MSANSQKRTLTNDKGKFEISQARPYGLQFFFRTQFRTLADAGVPLNPPSRA